MATSSLELGHRPSGHLAPPPDYETTEAVELSRLSPATSSTNSLPEYTTLYNIENGDSASSSSTSVFYPTKQLQIQAPGFALIRLPLPPQPDPIYVFNVAATGELDDAEANDPTQAALCTTTYRFGPGKPPKIRFVGDGSQNGQTEEIELSCKGVLTRSTIMRTHLGTFEWRYSSRAERRSAKASVGEDIDCLLILDQVMKVAIAGGKQEESRRKVGQFVRSDGLRTQGSRRSSAGNGGRLMLDLREWLDRKNEAIEMEILAVTMAIMGGASGGP
ncbi:uncharacterized protein FSUBG_6460 [Fusarium subglutinans]|uniref:Uncharacterized protein n=1 Tax=Gibberella subglutinans TaxID=42677 RepID=A0A8H5V252_GIBSU|nr:uncharacterized protein FSUBG_6460 [Fusarium subglutinans]KAF5605539.1 hypothetical protein FSUBG_6460 [Fusarium subglutinans]